MPASSHLWGPNSFPDAHSLRARTPLPADGGSQEASVICSQQLCSRGLQSWRLLFPPRALAVILQVGKCPLSLGSPGLLRPPAQKPTAVYGDTVWSVRTLVLNFGLVSGLQREEISCNIYHLATLSPTPSCDVSEPSPTAPSEDQCPRRPRPHHLLTTRPCCTGAFPAWLIEPGLTGPFLSHKGWETMPTPQCPLPSLFCPVL